MPKPSPRLRLILEQSLAWLALAVISFYAYVFFAVAPYSGFSWYALPGRVRVYETFVASTLRVDDFIIQIGPLVASDISSNVRQALFQDFRPGDKAPIIIERNGQTLSLEYQFPGFNRNEFIRRVNSPWWLAFVFWAFGLVTLLGLRPKDARWRLFVAFNFLTAICIAASVVSPWRMLESSVVLRMGLWLSLPVYWHLHWVSPKPLAPLPKFFWLPIYVISITFAIAEFFQLSHSYTYTVGFLAGVAGSILLLLARMVFKSEERMQTSLLLLAGILALLPPALVVTAETSFGSATTNALFFIPILPSAYLYSAYRHQLSGLEFRGNRLVSLYLFLFVLGLVLSLFIPLFSNILNISADMLFISVLVDLLIVVVVIFTFKPFQRFVERRLLGVLMSRTDLLKNFSAQIVASPDAQNIVRLLRSEILPSFLVRQSVLLHCDDELLSVIDSVGTSPDSIPFYPDLAGLLALSGRYLSPGNNSLPLYDWVRLALPLVVSQKSLGVWLLGHRDPDDFYSPQDIAVLQALANQMAIALTHIAQTGHLHALYRANIDQRETERASLARELHDNVLNQMAVMKMEFDKHTMSPVFVQRWDDTIVNLRQVVTGLRPAILNYGLHIALEALVDDLNDRTDENPLATFDVPESDSRYDLQIEQHLYRIVQQACENAIQHARAKTVRVYGRIELEHVDLTIEDDGMGFESGQQLDLAGLLANKHYGVAGMYERASLVDAHLQIHSTPGRGTNVQLRWEPDHR